MVPHVRSVELSTGVTLQYVEQGDPAGLPVLMLHGISDSWRSFELVLPHLPRSLPALALTQRGHGDSSRPESAYRARDFAADAAAFMDALDLETAVILGHSMGSSVAQRFVLDHPGRARGLVLLGAFAGMADNPAPRELWDVVSQMNDPVDPAFVRDFQRSTLAQSVPKDFFEAVAHESLKLPVRVWRAVLACNLQEHDPLPELSSVRAPTLIIWGDRDDICLRDDQDALAAAIPNAQLVVYHGAGHATHWEEPRHVAADRVAFIETLHNGSGAGP